MTTNLEKYKADIAKLIREGSILLIHLQWKHYPEDVEQQLGKDFAEIKKKFGEFGARYQAWYSEARAVIKQMLPDRLQDFVRQYEKPVNRKSITFENYVMEDCLQGLHITRGWEKETVVDASAGVPRLQQQLNILEAVEARFESTLFDIRQLVQADLFDSDLSAAALLAKNKFVRAAGAMAGVVLEKHLAQVCANHNVTTAKKNPTISDLNDLLKKAEVIDVARWRFIQHLGDLRNLCDHNKEKEPTKAEIDDLIDGVTKMTKTLF